MSISEAVLGSKVSVKTLQGDKLINIPAGISSGSKIKLANQGVSKLHPNQQQKGDMYVHVVVGIPKTLTPRQREIFEELKKLEEGTTIQAKPGKASTSEETSGEPKKAPEAAKEKETESCKKGFANKFKEWY